MMRRLRWIGALVLVGVLASTVHPEAQAVVAAQINNFWNLLKVGATDPVTSITYAFNNAAIVADGYLNFGPFRGVNGYGIRDTGGILQFKNSGGAWATLGGGIPTSTATFWIATADASVPNAKVLGVLGSGLVLNTTATGTPTIYGGSTCTNQFIRALAGNGSATCQAVALATDVSGTLAAANFPALTGDVTTPGGSLATTLASTGVGAGSEGSATSIPTFTVDAKGRLTAKGSATPQLTLTSTYFSSLAATNLTGIPGANVTGTLATAAFPALTGDVTNTVGTLATTVGKIGGNAVALGSAFTLSGAGGLTLTITGATSLTLPTTGTLITSTVTSLSSLSTVGTIGTGTWNGTIISPAFGGTGVNNSANTLTLAGNLATAGAFASTFTMTAPTAVTFPTTGTLVNSAVTTLSSLTTVGTLTNVAGSGTIGTVASPFATAVLGTAATNNLRITPAAFAAGVTATVSDPGIAAVKLPLVLRGTITWTVAAIPGNSCAASVTAVATGLATTASIVGGPNQSVAALTGWLSGDVHVYFYPTVNTVNMQVCNTEAGPLSPDTLTFNWVAFTP